MLIFIDESGDTGFKFEKGSSRYFVIVLIVFEDNLDAEETSLKIKRLKQKLKWSEATEFKFSKTKDKFRKEFFNAVRGCKFKFLALVVDKKKLAEGHLEGRNFYRYALTQSLVEFPNLKGDITFYFDKMADKSFVLSFNIYLRKLLKGKRKLRIKSIKHRRSTSNILIQLADMVSGAVFRKYEKDESTYYDQIKDRRF